MFDFVVENLNSILKILDSILSSIVNKKKVFFLQDVLKTVAIIILFHLRLKTVAKSFCFIYWVKILVVLRGFTLRVLEKFPFNIGVIFELQRC
jgi:hypothetical protein